MAEDVVALRQAFHRLADRRDTGAGCLDAEWIWAALAGERPPEEVRAGVLHLAECGECAEAWRLGRELALASDLDLANAPAVPMPARPSWRSPWVFLPAAAAALVLVVGVTVDRGLWSSRPVESGTTLRADREAGVTLSVADGATLPREAFVLRWEPPADASHYAVRVTTESLEPVASASSLLEPSYQVPPAELAALAPGTRLLWQVEAFGPERRRVQSPVSVVVVR